MAANLTRQHSDKTTASAGRDTIAVFVGGFGSFNVRQTTRNIGRMLSDRFDLELATSKPEVFESVSEAGFTVRAPVTGEGPLTEFRLLRAYLEEHSPDMLTQIGDVPVYGNLISLLKDHDTRFVCRYSGDLFTEYEHETGLDRAKIFLLKNGFGRVPLRYADRVIAMGPREKQRIVDRGVEPERVAILPPPIDTSRFANPGRPTGIDPAPGPIALFVGRVSRLKGAETMQQRLPEILERRPDLQFVFVGDCQYGFDLPAEYENRVTFTGRVDPVDVPAYFDAADVYVHPSLTEGISRAVLEALASDTPVVARDVGDLAYATSNLFATDDDFVNMVARFEELPVDDVEPFTLEALKPRYEAAFTDV